MPLELNGQPLILDDEALLRKYSKEHIFTVAKQYVKINNDPEMRRVETAPVHIPTSYNFYIMENGVRKSQGILRYYDAKNGYLENGRTIDNYTPQYISIGHSGIMKCSNVEMNYFLDNCPWNEKVKNDSLHANYQPNMPTLLNTFSRVQRAENELGNQKAASRIMSLLLDDKVYPTDRLKSLATVIVQQAGARKISHKLFDLDSIEDVALRSEMIRLCMTYTKAVEEIMNMQSTDLAEEIEKWKSLRIIEFTAENEWVFNETERNAKSIMVVPFNADPLKTLTYFLKEHDPYYKWYKPINDRYKYVSNKLRKKQAELENK